MGRRHPRRRFVGPGQHVQHAQEWFDPIRRIRASDERFDGDGTCFRNIRGLKGRRTPVRGSVPILSTAGSGPGREFATRNADCLFTRGIYLSRSKEEIAALRARTDTQGRKVGVLTFSHVIGRPTEQEAKDYMHHVGDENADREATDNLIRLQLAHAHSLSHDLLQQIRYGFALGHGGFPSVGAPDQAAAGIVSRHQAGFAGSTPSLRRLCERAPLLRGRGSAGS